MVINLIILEKRDFTFKERQCEFDQRTGSKTLIPVIVPIYLQRQTPQSAKEVDNHVKSLCRKMHLYAKQNHKKVHLRTLASSVSNIIRNRIPTETCRLQMAL